MQTITDYLTKEIPCNNNTSDCVATRTYFKILNQVSSSYSFVHFENSVDFITPYILQILKYRHIYH